LKIAKFQILPILWLGDSTANLANLQAELPAK